MMERIKLILLLAFFISSCTREGKSTELDRSNPQSAILEESVNTSKVVSSKSIADNNYALREISAYERALRFYKPSDTQFQEELKEQQKLKSFNLRISSNEEVNILDFDHPNFTSREEKLLYFMTDFQNSIKLVTKLDTIKPTITHLENPNPMVPYLNIIIGFDSKDFKDESTLVLEDNYLKTGRVKLKI